MAKRPAPFRCIPAFIACTLLGILWHQPLSALQIRQHNESRHHRILSTGAINPNFLFFDYDPSGIAIDQDTLQGAGRATMITRRHFVTASHTAATHPAQLTFMAQDGTRFTYPVDAYFPIASSTDLTIGRLVEPIPHDHGITHYAIARVVPPDYDAAMIGLFGMWRMAGVNRLDAGTLPGSELFRHDFDGHNNPLFGRGPDEAAPTQGDSGHPMVAAYAGRLFVLGVHYTTTSSQSVPKHIDQIRSIVEVDGESLTIMDTLPRIIADFDPARMDCIWQDYGTGGGLVPVTTQSPIPIGRITNSLSQHALIARSAHERPNIDHANGSFASIAFAPGQHLLGLNNHSGSARGFTFELNTEQPRILLLLRVQSRLDGVTPLAQLEYATAADPFTIAYDHATKRLLCSGFGSELSVAMPENTWVFVAWMRQREFIAISIDGNNPVRQAIHPSHNADTAFTRFTIGNSSEQEAVGTFQLARLMIMDTGLAQSPGLIIDLRQHYQLPARLLFDNVWWPDPNGSSLLRFVFETAPAPNGPWSALVIRSHQVSDQTDGWRLALSRVSAPARYLRINNGAPLRIATAATNLSIELSSHNCLNANITSPASAAFEANSDGAFRLRLPALAPNINFFRLIARETN